MTGSSHRQWSSDRSLPRDRIWILLTLFIGIGGMIFVFSIPDPFTTLAPQTPLLTHQDFPGSYFDTGISLGISAEGSWQEQRGFSTQLYFHYDTYAAGIEQSAIWYADPMKAAADWNEIDRTFYKAEPFVASTGGGGKPASLLFCGSAGPSLPEGFRECWYLVYWEHWSTEVNYRSQLAEDLHALEMQKIAARVDQLLMSAPAEPCYWILCVGTKNAVKP